MTAQDPPPRVISLEGVTLTHPNRELWPGITKQHLAEYWQAVAEHALPGLARRPLAIVRCPEGIDGEHFFQKRRGNHLPEEIREGRAAAQPYLAIDGVQGLVAMAQIAAIELHAWGATEADPLHPDRMVFDLDPGAGVAFPDVVRAAIDIRDELQKLGLQSFCRTTGGKGLHIVAPLEPAAGWEPVTAFCRAFAQALSATQPDRFLPTVGKSERRGRILIDWLRNTLGATSVASFSPRAWPGAPVATPLAWHEVTARLDPTAFTVISVPQRLARRKSDAWQGFTGLRQRLPELGDMPANGGSDQARPAPAKRPGASTTVSARKPRRRAQV